jgi:site-specific recombinase XerD
MHPKEDARMFTFSQIVAGYELHAQARQLSPRTLEDYNHTFRKLAAFLDGDPLFIDIAKSQVEQFLAAQTISKKTLLNYHIGLSALWKWAFTEGYVPANIIRQIEPPRPGRRDMIPFSESDVRALLGAIARSKRYNLNGTLISKQLPNQDRNRAIILLLLDTGMRAEELSELQIRHVDLKNRFARVIGKGDNERYLPFCPQTGQALWKYVAQRTNAYPTEPFFLTNENNAFDRHRLYKQLRRIAGRTDVGDVHPHRFRHTFAINYLRNGGDPYSLQIMLGHTTMAMVKKYLKIARADLQNFHRIASPVANWRL